MKILGIGICFAIMLGAFLQIGPDLYLDINSAIFVLGGATGFLVMKNKPENHIRNFGQGAVYFGWLGTVVGLIAITGTPFLCKVMSKKQARLWQWPCLPSYTAI